MLKTRKYTDASWSSETTTIVDLMKFMLENEIPTNAVIRYAGCGTHLIEFAWEINHAEGFVLRNGETLYESGKLKL